MKNEILNHLNSPGELEKMYRGNKSRFTKDFLELYPSLEGQGPAEFWHERLRYGKEETGWGSRSDIFFVIISAVVAGVLAKLPDIFNIDEEFFYPRNIGFLVFPFLTHWFARKNHLPVSRTVFIAAVFITGAVFINLLPDVRSSDTLMLASMHLLLILWAMTGLAFTNGHQTEKRLDYLKYNGDLLVMSALILIAGGIITAITIGLFSLIGLNIEQFYFDNVVVFSLPAVPLLATYLTQNNPQLVGKVSPVIARIFSPVVLVMLTIYLAAIIYSGKDPYNDREFLVFFNVLLIGVMALIFFSVAEAAKSERLRAEIWVLMLLAALTIAVNGIALSAILFRISEWGLTPNRLAVLGANLLIFINLLLVAVQLIRTLGGKTEISIVGTVIARFLPVYIAWAAVVTFLFPFLFGFR